MEKTIPNDNKAFAFLLHLANGTWPTNLKILHLFNSEPTGEEYVLNLGIHGPLIALRA